MTGERGVAIGHDAVNSQIVTGDQNQVIGTLVVSTSGDERELEIRLGPADASQARPVTVSFPSEQRKTEGVFSPSFTELELRSAVAALDRGLVQDAAVRQFGTDLFEVLFRGPTRALYDELRARGVRLRFRFVFEDTAMQRVPWELARDPARDLPLAWDASLVRTVHAASRSAPFHGQIQIAAPARLVVIDSSGVTSPSGAARTSAETIRRAVSGLVRTGQLVVQKVPKATIGRLEKTLRPPSMRAARDRSAHLLHIIAEGGVSQGTDGPALLVAGERGAVVAVDGQTLANHVAVSPPRVVFFSIRSSAGTTTLEIVNAFAPPLLATGVAAVVGLPADVVDQPAQQFLGDFYRRLIEGEIVDVALGAASRQVADESRNASSRPGLPVCYVAPGADRVLDVQSAPALSLGWDTWRPWLRQRVSLAWTVAVLTGLLGVLASVAILVPLVVAHFGPPPKMTGSGFRVAVTAFTQLDNSGGARAWAGGTELATSFAHELDQQRQSMQLGTTITVRGPDGTRALVGSTLQERAESAAALARDIEADVIIDGGIRPDGITFAPGLYLSERRLNDQTDVGYYDLGDIRLREGADIAGVVADQADVQQALVQQAITSMYLLAGLNSYGGSRFDAATVAFTAALGCLDDPSTCMRTANGPLASQRPTPATRAAGPAQLENETGRALLYLFLGNSALKAATAEHDSSAPAIDRQGALKTAQGYFEQSLGVEPAYGRARIGLAEVTFLQSIGSCVRARADTNADGLQRAAELYTDAQTGAIPHSVSNVDLKAAFGLGRVHLCLSQMGVDGFTADESERQLRRVVAAYDAGNTAIRPWTAEAHLDLGTLYSTQKFDTTRAVGEFMSSVDLYTTPGTEAPRKHLACQLLGSASFRAGEEAAGRPDVAALIDRANCRQDYMAGYENARKRSASNQLSG